MAAGASTIITSGSAAENDAASKTPNNSRINMYSATLVPVPDSTAAIADGAWA